MMIALTYAYRAMMETLLTYGFDAMTSHLTSGLFYKDTPGKMDAVDPIVDDENANLGKRHNHGCRHCSVSTFVASQVPSPRSVAVPMAWPSWLPAGEGLGASWAGT